MAPKKENSKKVAGNARKAEEAAKKQAMADQKKAAEEAAKWSKGAKNSSKQEAAEAKKAEAARKKAEKEALLKEEEAAAPSKPKAPKAAQKKYMPTRPSRVTPLAPEEQKPETINNTVVPVNSSGYDAKKLEKLDPKAVERHPERRYKAALALYEERRLPEVTKEYPGLRKNQRLLIIRKEFEKHPENPFNQLRVAYNASLDEVEQVLAHEKSGAQPDLE